VRVSIRERVNVAWYANESMTLQENDAVRTVDVVWSVGGQRVAWVLAAVWIVLSVIDAPSTRADPFYVDVFERAPSVDEMTRIGRMLFSDRSLSASGDTACATCHDPSAAYGPPNALAVQRAGLDGVTPGLRAVPSLRYGQSVPSFTEHFFDDEGDESVDQGPAGGRTWDGRLQSAHDQARAPLFSPFEMANGDEAAVVAKVRDAPYANQFRATFGAHVFDRPESAFKAILLSLEVFQQSPTDFYPYSSKYDAWLRGQLELSPRERRGLTLFEDPNRGNCARCHPSAMKGAAFPQFSDYGFVALGVPRNAEIPANADATFFDLGLCGPLRTDLKDRPEYCGRFRTPTLRNVATRRVFFHNGFVKALGDAIRFYVERDAVPQRWYPTVRGRATIKFDDLPAPYRGNVDASAPFGASIGSQPALGDDDIADLIAFLETLTDGYAPASTTAR
jgi:cytochrome c peroxidase